MRDITLKTFCFLESETRVNSCKHIIQNKLILPTYHKRDKNLRIFNQSQSQINEIIMTYLI